jgi:alpha-ketoglutarate-dependent taurine dioxygenase
MLNAVETTQEGFELRRLSPTFGVEIRGVDLAQPMTDALFDRIYEAFLSDQLLLFRDQRLEPGGQVGFARRFGSVQVHMISDGRFPAPSDRTISSLRLTGRSRRSWRAICGGR